MAKGKIKLKGVAHLEEADVMISSSCVVLTGKEFDIGALPLDVPVSGAVYGTLLNYEGALQSLGKAVNQDPYKKPPEAPILYIKPINTLTAYGSTIPLPKKCSELEMGATLGIVMGRTATRVSRNEALDFVGGYTIVNDVSIPHESYYRPSVDKKARDGFCPVGPWIISPEDVGNPNDLGVRVYINDELKQENNTRHLIRSIEQLISDVTEFMTLYAGDLLLVGVPENPPLAKDGDHVRIEIDRMGSLENIIVREDRVIGGIQL